jgi:hypothetical protein
MQISRYLAKTTCVNQPPNEAPTTEKRPPGNANLPIVGFCPIQPTQHRPPSIPPHRKSIQKQPFPRPKN